MTDMRERVARAFERECLMTQTEAFDAAGIALLECGWEEMRQALEKLTEHYCELVNSGDAGFWDPEKEGPVIAARSALAKANPKGGE